MFKHKQSVALQQIQPEEDDPQSDFTPSEANVNIYDRNNVRIVAFADILTAIIVIVDFSISAAEVELVHHHKFDLKNNKEHIFLVVTVTFIVFVCVGLIFTFFLLKATNFKMSRAEALKKATAWLYYSYLLQILTPVLIVVTVVYAKNNEAGIIAVGVLAFVVRVVFIIVVFRFARDLKWGRNFSMAVSGRARPSMAVSVRARASTAAPPPQVDVAEEQKK